MESAGHLDMLTGGPETEPLDFFIYSMCTVPQHLPCGRCLISEATSPARHAPAYFTAQARITASPPLPWYSRQAHRDSTRVHSRKPPSAYITAEPALESLSRLSGMWDARPRSRAWDGEDTVVTSRSLGSTLNADRSVQQPPTARFGAAPALPRNYGAPPHPSCVRRSSTSQDGSAVSSVVHRRLARHSGHDASLRVIAGRESAHTQGGAVAAREKRRVASLSAHQAEHIMYVDLNRSLTRAARTLHLRRRSFPALCCP